MYIHKLHGYFWTLDSSKNSEIILLDGTGSGCKGAHGWQLCTFTQNHSTVHLGWVSFLTFKLYPNETVKKKKNQQHSTAIYLERSLAIEGLLTGEKKLGIAAPIPHLHTPTPTTEPVPTSIYFWKHWVISVRFTVLLSEVMNLIPPHLPLPWLIKEVILHDECCVQSELNSSELFSRPHYCLSESVCWEPSLPQSTKRILESLRTTSLPSFPPLRKILLKDRRKSS